MKVFVVYQSDLDYLNILKAFQSKKDAESYVKELNKKYIHCYFWIDWCDVK